MTVFTFPKKVKDHFLTPEKACKIEDKIYLKGTESKFIEILVRQNESGESELSLTGDATRPGVALPSKADCVLNETSPFYRCNNTRITVTKDQELEFPGQLQVSYADKTFACDHRATKDTNNSEKGYFDRYLGI